MGPERGINARWRQINRYVFFVFPLSAADTDIFLQIPLHYVRSMSGYLSPPIHVFNHDAPHRDIVHVKDTWSPVSPLYNSLLILHS